MNKFLAGEGLECALDLLKSVLGAREPVQSNGAARTQFLLEIDYENDLAFNINWIVGDNSPYVGSAVVGQAYVA